MRVVLIDLLAMTPDYDRHLVRALEDAGVEVSLASITAQHEPRALAGIRREPILDLCARFFPGLPRRYRQPLKALEALINMSWFGLRSRFGSSRPDLVHVQWCPLLSATTVELRFIQAIRRAGIPVVFTAHNLLPHDTGRRHEAAYARLYSLVDGIVCHTASTAEEIARRYSIDPSRLAVIPHGAMFQEEAERLLQGGAIDRDGPVKVLAFGNIRPYKGLERLLEAWGQVVERNPDVRLEIAGQGPDDYVQSIRKAVADHPARATIDLDVRFVPTDELLSKIARSDIVVFPYRAISQSGALLTAMSFGKALVATDVGGFRETLRSGETGLLVQPEDAASLGEAIHRLVNSPEERERLGQAALHEARTRLGWKAIAAETLRFYQRLVPSPGVSPDPRNLDSH